MEVVIDLSVLPVVCHLRLFEEGILVKLKDRPRQSFQMISIIQLSPEVITIFHPHPLRYFLLTPLKLKNPREPIIRTIFVQS